MAQIRCPPAGLELGEQVLVAHRIFAEWDMSNANARAVLEALGEVFSPDCQWQGTAGGLLEACQRWLQGPGPIIGDEGQEARQEGILIDCGRRQGYLKDRVTLLRDEALRALGQGGLQTEVAIY